MFSKHTKNSVEVVSIIHRKAGLFSDPDRFKTHNSSIGYGVMPTLKNVSYRLLCAITLVITSMIWAYPAKADFGIDPMLYSVGDPSMNIFIATTYINQSIINQSAYSKVTKPVSNTIAPAAIGKPKGPTKLAAKLKVTAAQRVNIIKAFEYSLNTYVKLEKALKIPKNDVSGALAAYLAGNYAAYRNVPLSDATFKTVVNQMRSLLLKMPAFKKSTGLAKRDLYEQWAIGGMFTYLANLEAKQQRPVNKPLLLKIKLLAKANIEKSLRINVAKMRINANGLVAVR